MQSELETLKKNIKKNSVDQIQIFNNCHLKNSTEFRKNILRFSVKNRFFDLANYLINHQEILIYDIIDVININNIDKLNIKFDLYQNIHYLMDKIIYLNKSDLFIHILDKLIIIYFNLIKKKKNILKNKKIISSWKYNRILKSLNTKFQIFKEILSYSIIYKNSEIIDYITSYSNNKNLIDLQVLKKSLINDNGTILEYLHQDKRLINIINSNKAKLSDFIYKTNNSCLINSFFKYTDNNYFDKLIKSIESRIITEKFIDVKKLNLQEINLVTKLLVKYDYLDIFIKKFPNIKNKELIKICLNNQSFESLSKIIKHTNFSYKDDTLNLDILGDELNIKFLNKVLDNYGNLHFNDFSLIISKLKYSEFINLKDKICNFNLSNPKISLTFIRKFHLYPNLVNDLHFLNKNKISWHPKILNTILLFFVSTSQLQLQYIIALNYLVCNNINQLKINSDFFNLMNELYEETEYFGTYDRIGFIKKFIYELIKNNTNNSFKISGLFDIEYGNNIDYNTNFEEESCCICKNNYDKNDEIFQLSCGHIFHKSCIHNSLDINNSCPICRKHFFFYDF